MRTFDGFSAILTEPDSEEIIGYVGGTKTELKNLWVRKDHRCKGVGSGLFTLYWKWANPDFIVLVKVGNEVAKKFYEIHDLRVVGFGKDENNKEYWVMSSVARKGKMILEGDEI